HSHQLRLVLGFGDISIVLGEGSQAELSEQPAESPHQESLLGSPEVNASLLENQCLKEAILALAERVRRAQWQNVPLHMVGGGRLHGLVSAIRPKRAGAVRTLPSSRGTSKISPTRPSPRMVDPARPDTESNILPSGLITTWPLPRTSSTARPALRPRWLT